MRIASSRTASASFSTEPALTASSIADRDRALVVPNGIDQLTSDVRENAEVLLDAGEQLARLAAAVERLKELGARLFQRAGPQRQPTHRVQRFGGEDVVAERASDFIAAVAQVARSG